MDTRAVRYVRLGVATAFGTLALCCTGLALFIASRATDSNADSPSSTYLILGGIVLILATCLAFVAWEAFKGRSAFALPWLIVSCLFVAVLFVLTTSPLFLFGFILLAALMGLSLLISPKSGT